MGSFVSINPFTEEQLASYPLISSAELETALADAVLAQKEWKNTTFSARAKFFSNLATLIKANADRLASLAAMEMGKTLAEGKLEVLKCARGCEFYAEHSEKMLRPEITVIEGGKEVHVSHEPMGVILGIFPWNFPYWQIVRSASPVVMAGNAMLIKPSPNTPQCALALQDLFSQAGFPAGLMQTIFASEEQIAALIPDSRIAACTLTGSERAGSAVASNAAKHIKKSVLELGGSDPFIVLEDANLDLALSSAITARFQNNGQSCLAAKRFILHQKIADSFLQKLTAEVKKLRVGDPMNNETNIGPLARKDLRDKLKKQVDDSVAQGAHIHFQGQHLPQKGFFYPPTILTGVTKNAVAWHEELFGPVLSVFVVKSEADAVKIANDTLFGLGASVWTADIARGRRLGREIETGNVFINQMVKSDPRFPFGGVKKSGFGRELGEQGLKEFCNVKTILF